MIVASRFALIYFCFRISFLDSKYSQNLSETEQGEVECFEYCKKSKSSSMDHNPGYPKVWKNGFLIFKSSYDLDF